MIAAQRPKTRKGSEEKGVSAIKRQIEMDIIQGFDEFESK
jgi:hypothetical protein